MDDSLSMPASPSRRRFSSSAGTDSPVFTELAKAHAAEARKALSDIAVARRGTPALLHHPSPMVDVKSDEATVAGSRPAQTATRSLRPISLEEGRHVSTNMLSRFKAVDIFKSPEKENVLCGISIALHTHMVASAKTEPLFAAPSPHLQYQLFSERNHPLTADVDRSFPMPEAREVHAFLTEMHARLDIDVSVLVMTLIYMERAMKLNAWPLRPDTWRRMFLAGFLEAAKVLFDELVYNVDLTEAFPDWQLEDINDLELLLFEGIDFNLYVRSSTYAKYYFAVTAVSRSETRRKAVGAAAAPGSGAVRDALADMGARVEKMTIDGAMRMPAHIRRNRTMRVPRPLSHQRSMP
mmetsp:Transcript_6918/g.20465  ORF Transcript_6918/g.20465 Transcript_6918/m.20465 type:complete len:352 (-) Transcript_6918:70-1125(-)